MKEVLKDFDKRDINKTDNKYDYTPLKSAIMSDTGSVEKVQLICEYGADVQQSDTSGCTPLHWAADRGNQSVCDILISRGAKVYIYDEDENTPINSALKNFHVDCGMYLFEKHALLEKYAFVKHKNRFGDTILHFCAKTNRYIEFTKKILALDKSVLDEKNRTGETPLLLAAKNGQADLMRFLIRNGADTLARVNSSSGEKGFTLLHIARSGIIENLFKFKSEFKFNLPDINDNQNDYSYTPLHTAALRDCDAEKVSLLLKYNADVKALDREKMTILHLAAIHDLPEIIEEIPQENVSDLLYHQDENGMTPLHWALLKSLSTESRMVARSRSATQLVNLAKQNQMLDSLLKIKMTKEPINYRGRCLLLKGKTAVDLDPSLSNELDRGCRLT